MWPFITDSIRTYSVFYTVAIIVHLVSAIVLAPRFGQRRMYGVALGCVFFFGMVLGAKLLYDVLHDRFLWSNYLSVAYYMAGGMWGGPLAYLAMAVPLALVRRDTWRDRLDLATLTLPVPMFLAKVACLVNGCCHGRATELPWAITFPEGAGISAGVARHPTALYEMIVIALLGLVLLRLDRVRWRGTLLLWFGLIYGIGRPLTEIFRGDGDRVPSIGPLTASQAVCLAGAAVCAAALSIVARRRRVGVPLSPTLIPEPAFAKSGRIDNGAYALPPDPDNR